MNNWKTYVTGIALVFGLIGSILALDDRYATSKELNTVEVKLVENLKMFQQQFHQNQLESRYITLNEQLRQVRILLYKYPDDRTLLEDKENILRELEDVKRRLQEQKRS